jgi:cytidine deaminase
MNPSILIEAAIAAREKAYAPYSKFAVGAALLAADGRVFLGCNVENISFGLTQCAERAAITAAVAAGVKNFQMIAVVSDSNEPISPCGACRQVMLEFSENLKIVTATLAGKTYDTTLDILLPRGKSGILG